MIHALAFCIALSGNGFAPSTAKPVHHYVFVNRDRERIRDAAFLQTKAFEGAQIKYTWRELEPARGTYDFSDIRADLAFLNSHGKKLFMQIQDSSFALSIIPVPRYLLTDLRFHGGIDRQYTIKGEDEREVVPYGWVARRWDPAVRARFGSLLMALGKEFDGKIEGINLPETAVDFGETGRWYPAGFTLQKYRDGVVSNMVALKRAFPRSVAMQYANFMPGGGSYLRSVYQQAKRLRVGVGGPDLLPYRPGQMAADYPLIREFSGTIPTGIAVQEGNYESKDSKMGKPIPIPERLRFAEQYLKVDYVFWCTQEPFYSKELIPFLVRTTRRVRTDD